MRGQTDRLRGQRVGLVTHPAAVMNDFSSAVDALLVAGINVTALFGPEHGLDGSAADATAVPDAIHPRTHLPVFSLYGETREPTAAMLANVDILLFDMQDVGARFYTFISTLYHALKGAARARRPVLVLDRPNPLDGVHVQGPAVQAGLESFIGVVSIPVRHGMTCGELAHYMNATCRIHADLGVIALQGWQRRMWFDETGLPWVPLSPGMPHLSTAIAYPGMCLLEGTNLSEGRGTALPFEVAGAPWLDGDALARALNAMQLPGARFRPVRFVPFAGRYMREKCYGVQLHVIDRASFCAIDAGLYLIAACRDQAPDHFAFLTSSWEGPAPHLDLLIGNADIREGLAHGAPVESLTTAWHVQEAEFEKKRARYLLYA